MKIEDYISIMLLIIGYALIPYGITFLINGKFIQFFICLIFSGLAFLTISIVEYKVKVE